MRRMRPPGIPLRFVLGVVTQFQVPIPTLVVLVGTRLCARVRIGELGTLATTATGVAPAGVCL